MEPSTAESAPSLVYAHPARIIIPDDERATPAALLELAKKQALSPSAFDNGAPFFWSAEISSNRIDAFSTRMMPSSLKNYAQDATNGVAFLNSHNTDELPLGRSLQGTFTGSQGNGISRVLVDFYTLRGLRLGQLTTDEFIAGVLSGIVSDVSVGIYGGKWVCSIDGLDMRRDYNCPHLPGRSYPKKNAKGEDTGEMVTAYGLIEDAHLAEVSAVFSGATPNAGILKAFEMAEAGRLSPAEARLVEIEYRIKLPREERHMTEKQNQAAVETPTPASLEDVTAAVRAALGESGTTAADPVAEVRLLVEERAAIRAAVVRAGGEKLTTPAHIDQQAAELKRLAPLAEIGEQYRKDLVEETLAAGVRALGDKFPAEAQREMLATASLAHVKAMRDTWQAMGDQRFPGGRVTTDPEEQAAVAVSNGTGPRIPDAHYRA